MVAYFAGVDVPAFVEHHLQPRPVPILEIGCGSGELAPVVTVDHEQSLIDSGAIEATGFDFVGERPG